MYKTKSSSRNINIKSQINIIASMTTLDFISQSPLIRIPCSSLFGGTIFKIPSLEKFPQVPYSTVPLAAWSLRSLVLLGSTNLTSLCTRLVDTAGSDRCKDWNWLTETGKPNTELEGSSELGRRVGWLDLLGAAFPLTGFIWQVWIGSQSCSM